MLAGGFFLFPPYLAQQTEQRLAQARRASRTYEETGWQFAIKDSFRLEVVRRGNLYAPVPNLHPPEFPGGDAVLTQQLARLVAPAAIPDAYRVGFAATVEVEFILEPTGCPTSPAVSAPATMKRPSTPLRNYPPSAPPAGATASPLPLSGK